MSEKPRVLIADDEQNIRRVLRALLSRAGYETETVADGLEALEAMARSGPFDCIVTDLKMPRMDGMELLRTVADDHPDTPVVVITAHGSVGSAVEAVKLGAFDYIQKPFEKDQIRQVVGKAVSTAEHSRQHARVDAPSPPAPADRCGLIGGSDAMHELYEVIKKVADTPSTVLITGESGTGKELVAKALHKLSSRAEKPFIKINCAAIPATLIESELFGHEKGSFTGAISSKPGRFELADGGTLLLDEIGEIPAPIQVKLLRALQENEFERVGGLKTIKVDVRLIAATNKNLEEEIAKGRFREDVYYRLNVVPLHMAPLRDRTEDIEELVEHFLKRFGEKLNRTVEGLEPDALEALRGYPWPGNIRELENVIERTLLFCDSERIHADDLPPEVVQPSGKQIRAVPAAKPAAAQAAAGGSRSLKEVVKDETKRLEREMILNALEETGGNVTRAARLLKISRKSLQLKMKELGLRQRTSTPDPDRG